jgi:hypothetical protein
MCSGSTPARSSVGEPEDEHVLHRLLPEKVIDPVDLILAERSAQAAIQLAGAGSIVAERLLDHQAPPAASLVASSTVPRRPAMGLNRAGGTARWNSTLSGC